MSSIYPSDRNMFDEGVLRFNEDNTHLGTELFGLLRTADYKHILPCRYKGIISYRNGFARAIDLAGRLVYVNESGDQFFDPQLPFVHELCEDFDEDGKAKIACLVNGSIIRGIMEDDGTIHLKDYTDKRPYIYIY